MGERRRVRQPCTASSINRGYADSWQDRFDPESYGPVASKKKKAMARLRRIDPIEFDETGLRSEFECVEPPPERCRADTQSVCGLAIGLDKTELDEEETLEFLQFVAEAQKNKSIARRKVRLLPTSENLR